MTNPACLARHHLWSGHGICRGAALSGYAIASINSALATVKRYCAVAAKAGVIDASALALINEVKGFSHKQGRNIDEARKAVTRIGHKKAEAIVITKAKAANSNTVNPTPHRAGAMRSCCVCSWITGCAAGKSPSSDGTP